MSLKSTKPFVHLLHALFLQDVQQIEAKLSQFKKDKPKGVPANPKAAQLAMVWMHFSSANNKSAAIN